MKKNYSIAERERFHRNRVNSSKATDSQKVYSRHWLDGFSDEHADNNLKAVTGELARRKKLIKERENEVKSIKSVNRDVLSGYIRGLQAGLNKRK